MKGVRGGPGARLLLHLGLTLAVASSACSASGSLRDESPQETGGFEQEEGPFSGATLLVSPSAVDVGHVYKSAVKVFHGAREPERDKSCSGVLIGPRLVLTAAHCVCFAREASPSDKARRALTPKEKVKLPEGRASPAGGGREIVITKARALKETAPIGYVYEARSDCLSRVSVEKVSYRSHPGGRGHQVITDACMGRVWVQPDFEVLLDINRNLVWGSADLALILLNQPFEPPLTEQGFVALTQAEAAPDDPIVLVGYGRGDSWRSYGDRQSGENKVAGLMRLETGSTVIAITGQQLADGGVASHVYGGDSGGACLSRSDPAVLVGIVSMGAKNKRGEPISLCMSVDSHRAWLEQMRKELESQPMLDCEPS